MHSCGHQSVSQKMHHRRLRKMYKIVQNKVALPVLVLHQPWLFACRSGGLDSPSHVVPSRLFHCPSNGARLALQHHPDKNPHLQEEAAKKFQQITSAYETIMTHLKLAGHG